MHQHIRRRGEKNTKNTLYSAYKLMFVASLVCFVFSIGFYLISINTLASKGTEMRVVEKEITKLSAQHRKLKIHETELKSLRGIEKISKEMGMKKPDRIQYIKETGPVAFVQ